MERKENQKKRGDIDESYYIRKEYEPESDRWHAENKSASRVIDIV